MNNFFKVINVLAVVFCIGFICANVPWKELRCKSKNDTVTLSDQEKIEKSTFLYFGADWCVPCRQMKELFKDKDVKKELDKLDFIVYNVDVDTDEALRWKVRAVPTMIFIDREGNVTRITGLKSKKNLLEILKKYSSPT